jgi:hypothetical protein
MNNRVDHTCSEAAGLTAFAVRVAAMRNTIGFKPGNYMNAVNAECKYR